MTSLVVLTRAAGEAAASGSSYRRTERGKAGIWRVEYTLRVSFRFQGEARFALLELLVSGGGWEVVFLLGGEGELLAGMLEVGESEGGVEGELKSGAGDEGFGSEEEEGGAGLFGEIAKAVPGGGWDLAEFVEG